MTIEEAKDYIREWCPYDRQEEIIKTLEQEPCEDAISRKAVLNTIRDWWKTAMMADGEPTLCDSIRDLPPVTPQPKTGHWKPFDLTFGRSIYYCTVCQKSVEGNLFNYCPNCGAKMIEPQESENKK